MLMSNASDAEISRDEPPQERNRTNPIGPNHSKFKKKPEFFGSTRAKCVQTFEISDLVRLCSKFRVAASRTHAWTDLCLQAT